MGNVRQLRAVRGNDERTLLTLDEVADVLRCSKRTVYRLIKGGELHPIKLGRAHTVAAEDVEAYRQSLREAPTP